jgi:hypothetical protein
LPLKIDLYLEHRPRRPIRDKAFSMLSEVTRHKLRLLLRTERMLFRLDGTVNRRKATVRAMRHVFGVGVAPFIIEVQYEANAGYLTFL